MDTNKSAAHSAHHRKGPSEPADRIRFNMEPAPRTQDQGPADGSSQSANTGTPDRCLGRISLLLDRRREPTATGIPRRRRGSQLAGTAERGLISSDDGGALVPNQNLPPIPLQVPRNTEQQQKRERRPVPKYADQRTRLGPPSPTFGHGRRRFHRRRRRRHGTTGPSGRRN